MVHEMRIAVILPAAGRSRRFGGGEVKGRGKLEREVAGRAVLLRAVELFIHRAEVGQVIVAADPDDLDRFKLKWGDRLGLMGVKIVAGGRRERWETVQNALREVGPEVTHVAVHDAARPAASEGMIRRVFDAAWAHDAVIPVVPVNATIKRLVEGNSKLGTEGGRRVAETVPRSDLTLAQTPQVFERSLIERAYGRIAEDTAAVGVTDDASLVEGLGEPVVAVEGDPLNVKITRPGDLELVQAVLTMRGEASEEGIGPKRRHSTWAQMEDEEW